MRVWKIIYRQEVAGYPVDIAIQVPAEKKETADWMASVVLQTLVSLPKEWAFLAREILPPSPEEWQAELAQQEAARGKIGIFGPLD